MTQEEASECARMIAEKFASQVPEEHRVNVNTMCHAAFMEGWSREGRDHAAEKVKAIRARIRERIAALQT